MKKILNVIILSMMIPSLAFGSCDFSLIKPLADGNFEYPKVCHEYVGVMSKQIADLNKAIQLDNDALLKADTRADNWMSTSLKLEEQFQKTSQLQKSNEDLYFGLGILATVLTGFAVANLTHRN
jgi:hypothetical protein